MASTDFPENERPLEEDTPAEKAADSQPSIEDYAGAESNGLSWAYNHKKLADFDTYDNRVMNLNQKIVGDAQAQAIFWQNVQERQAALRLAQAEAKLALQQEQQALVEQRQQFWQTMRQDQSLFADQRGHQATLNSVEYQRARDQVAISDRTVEPTREEVIRDATSAAVNQAVDTVTRAMVDRTQTSAANISELSAARQTADVNVINTLAEVAGVVNTMQAQSATSQAAYQALANQVAELTGIVQALSKNAK